MRFTLSVRKEPPTPRWRFTFIRKSQLRPWETTAQTEGLAVRNLMRKGVNPRIVDRLVQIASWTIIFLCTFKRR